VPGTYRSTTAASIYGLITAQTAARTRPLTPMGGHADQGTEYPEAHVDFGDPTRIP
jgi:hypothetical protein